MNQTHKTHQPVNYRIANFTDVPLQTAYQLHINPQLSSADELQKQIRCYADLPFIYLITENQSDTISDLLTSLKSIRSTCYPHAVYVIGKTDHASRLHSSHSDHLDIIQTGEADPDTLASKIREDAHFRFSFNPDSLKVTQDNPCPDVVDVLIIGAGITGLYAASRLKENNISFCILDKRDVTGGIWSAYANTTSQVNSSEGSYRLIEKTARSNRDHSFAREILGDIAQLTDSLTNHIHLNSEVKRIQRTGRGYRVTVAKGGKTSVIPARGVILAINDRVGEPRLISWKNESRFQGEIVSGISDGAIDTDWKDKHVVVVGMGAFAIEKARTALEAGAKHVTVVCRRHGTVCPKIIDYLNFATPYDENFTHDKKSNLRNMLLWKKLYDLSGATQPECWPKKVKHTGHTISVSDLWFIGHYLKKIKTVTGNIEDIHEKGIITDSGEFIDADVIVNCVGFTRNSNLVRDLCDYDKTYTNNYLDKDFMYLADAYIDDDAFNSFFGSSVLEMVKFYMGVYIRFFDNTDYEVMINSPGIEQIPVTERAWSTYIRGAEDLIEKYPEIRELAQKQVSERTSNFLESHDLETYIAQNKREWFDTHSLLAGRPMKEEECLPFVFQKLLK